VSSVVSKTVCGRQNCAWHTGIIEGVGNENLDAAGLDTRRRSTYDSQSDCVVHVTRFVVLRPSAWSRSGGCGQTAREVYGIVAVTSRTRHEDRADWLASGQWSVSVRW